jgi:hypothetical protein
MVMKPIDIMTPALSLNPSSTPFSKAVAVAKKNYRADKEPRTLVEKIAAKQAEPYTPLLITENATPAELDSLVTKMRVAGMRAVDEAIQRGRFNYTDIEKITAALAVLVLHPNADQNTYKTSTAMGAHLDRLIRLIQSRETVEMTAETVQRIRTIEDALTELSE